MFNEFKEFKQIDMGANNKKKKAYTVAATIEVIVIALCFAIMIKNLLKWNLTIVIGSIVIGLIFFGIFFITMKVSKSFNDNNDDK